MPAAARFRELITIEKPIAAPSRNKLGEVDRTAESTWETHCSAWAEILAKGSREFSRRGVTSDETTHAIAIRWGETAASTLGTYRIKRANGSYLALQGPLSDPDNKRRELRGEAIG